MTLPPELLDQVVESVADRVAQRVLERLNAAPPGPMVEGDGWRLWSLAETAGRLGRSTRWVREQKDRGALPFVRLDGGALAFLPDDVRAFAEARRIAADRGRNERGPLAAVR